MGHEKATGREGGRPGQVLEEARGGLFDVDPARKSRQGAQAGALCEGYGHRNFKGSLPSFLFILWKSVEGPF